MNASFQSKSGSQLTVSKMVPPVGQTYAEILAEFGTYAITHEDMQAEESLFAYQGFDPVRIVRNLEQKGGEHFTRDAKLMIVLALTRDTKISKILGKVSDEGKARVDELKGRYGLVDQAKTRDDITTARVAASLPSWTIHSAAVLGDSLPMGPRKFREESKVDIPACMCCPAFGACIPDSVITAEWRSLLRKAFFAWQHHFTLLINPNTRGKLKSVSSKGYVQAVDAAINASPFASQARVDLLMMSTRCRTWPQLSTC